MTGEDIQPGVTLIVPRGGDMTRVRPYRLKVTEVYLRSGETGCVHVRGELFRLDGTRPWRTRYRSRGPVTIAAILNPARIQYVITDHSAQHDKDTP